jgi:hypothetical protein
MAMPADMAPLAYLNAYVALRNVSGDADVRCGLTAAALLLSSNPVHHSPCGECFVQRPSEQNIAAY